ncbi:hypothetical protein ACL6C3_12760 [Capilliphycus salinus ALCB114379]|uniref:hypothetical protein n=1 Tax=Capilliphycus salinus TaxID=2768948 RepID=UPI0039A45774
MKRVPSSWKNRKNSLEKLKEVIGTPPLKGGACILPSRVNREESRKLVAKVYKKNENFRQDLLHNWLDFFG